jgi:WD40 repeat protein
MRGHTGAIKGARELSNRNIVSWSADGTLRLWRPDGFPQGEATTFDAIDDVIAIDGGRFLTWSRDGTFCLWRGAGIQEAGPWRGHDDRVVSVSTLADGRFLSWSRDATLRIWHADGTLAATLRGHTDWVLGAVILPRGLIMSWSRDGTIRYWGSDGTSVGRSVPGDVHGACVVPNGRILLWHQESLRLYDPDGTLVAGWSPRSDSEYVSGAVGYPDSRLLSWHRSGEVRVWRPDLSPFDLCHAKLNSIDDVVLLGGGSYVAWGKGASLMGLGHPEPWLSRSDTESRMLDLGHRGIQCVLPVADDFFLSGGEDGTLRLWYANGGLVDTWKGHRQAVKGAVLLKNGQVLSWSDDHTLRLWPFDNLASRRNLPQPSIEVLLATAGTIDLSRVEPILLDEPKGALAVRRGGLLVWKTHRLELWSTEGLRERLMLTHEYVIRGAVVLRNGRLLSWSNQELCFWHDDGTPIMMPRLSHRAGVVGWLARGLAAIDNRQRARYGMDQRTDTPAVIRQSLSPLGPLPLPDNRVVYWGRFGYEMFFCHSDGTPAAGPLPGHDHDVTGGRVLSDGRILSWSLDLTLRIWNADGTPTAILRGHDEDIIGASELADARILSWSKDGTLRLWRRDGQPSTVPLRGHGAPVLGAVALSSLSGGRILSWSEDTWLRLWNADGTASGKPMIGHEERIIGADVLWDGRVLSWSEDRTLRLWRFDGTPTGHPLRGHTGAIRGVRIIPKKGIVSFEDRRICAWAADGRLVHTIPLDGEIVYFDKSMLVIARDGNILMYDFDFERIWPPDAAHFS